MNFFLFKTSYLDYPLPGQLGFQSPASPVMWGIIDLHHHVMFFLVIVIVFTFCMLYYTLENYTVLIGNKVNAFLKVKNLYNIKITHHTALETIWIIIPSLILLSIVLPSFALLYAMDITKDCMLAMKVIGHQWYWSYEFVFNIKHINVRFSPNPMHKDYGLLDVVQFGFDSYMVPTEELSEYGVRLLETTNPVVLPYKTYIKACVTASDVIHSWAIPSLGIKIDALPGRLNQVMLYIDRIGRFYGQCSELCGVNHGFMPIEIYAVTKLDYMVYLSYACEDFRAHQFYMFLTNPTNPLVEAFLNIHLEYRKFIKEGNWMIPEYYIRAALKSNFSNWTGETFNELVKKKY